MTNNLDRIIAYIVAGVMVFTLFTSLRQEPQQIVVQQPEKAESSSIDKLVDIMTIQMLSSMNTQNTDPSVGGVYSQVINEFYQGLKAGTSNQFVVDSSGNVTAGTITSTGALSSSAGLSGTTGTFSGALSALSAIITGAFTSDTPTFVVDATNNKVGMGTTTPTALLTVGSTTPTHLTSGNQYRSGYIDGELEVDGNSWFDGILNASSTSFFTGAMRLFSSLTVDGASSFATTTVGTTDFVVNTDLNKIGVGTSSPASLFNVEDSAGTSTITASSGSASSGGRIILEDSDGAGCSEIYILNGTITSATVTCPTGI